MNQLVERFLKYVQFHTTSDEASLSCPSTNRQLQFAQYLREECIAIGLSNVTIDENGYVMAELPSNTNKSIPVIGFISHMDTSPEASGENVTPKIIENYGGGTIPLNKLALSPYEFPELLAYLGETLITTDGTTLLGADDKAGIAEIMTAMEYLLHHKEIEHGTCKICFTPDEEIGRGADRFNLCTFGADFAYTIDGGQLGELQYENFNAARVDITIKGKSVHPGTAKNIMINAALIGTEIASALPAEETPGQTEGYEGFYHLIHFDGNVSEAKLSYIIRDFDLLSFSNRKSVLRSIVEEKNKKYNHIITIDIRDEYYNMGTQLQDHMEIISLAKDAMESCHIKPVIRPIRGGTDGARLSFMGLPCPNLFTGGHNFHGPYEFIPVSSMEKAVELIVKIASTAHTIGKPSA